MTETAVQFYELEPNVEYVKIYGLQRSGTNFITHIINENFDNTKVLVNLGGWKHGYYAAPWIIGQEVHIAVVAKDPYAWLVSLYNYWGPKRKKKIGQDLDGVSFSDFLHNRVYFENQQSIPYLLRAANPIQHWNNMYFHWSSIRLNVKNVCMMAYEAFLIDPENSLEIMRKVLGLKRKSKDIVLPTNILKPTGENIELSKKTWNDKEYYLQKEYLAYYTPELIEFVNSQLDIELMIQFAYNYVLPEELK